MWQGISVSVTSHQPVHTLSTLSESNHNHHHQWWCCQTTSTHQISSSSRAGVEGKQQQRGSRHVVYRASRWVLFLPFCFSVLNVYFITSYMYITTMNSHDYNASTHDCHHKNTQNTQKGPDDGVKPLYGPPCCHVTSTYPIGNGSRAAEAGQ